VGAVSRRQRALVVTGSFASGGAAALQVRPFPSCLFL